MARRSTRAEHVRRIHEIRYLIQTGVSKQVSELIMQSRYKISREAARVLRVKAEKLENVPEKIEQINYSSLTNRLSVEIENTLFDYAKEDDIEKKESIMRSFDKLVKALEKVSTLSDTYIIDTAKY
tara:strand:+ start:360 stop:737 length:378 start_codon:yes stop_codon:yes gene_type:complete